MTGKNVHLVAPGSRTDDACLLPISAEHFEGGLTVVGRTSGAPVPLVRSFIETARDVDPNVATSSVKTMDQRQDVQLWPFLMLSWTFSISFCGALAIVFATVGLCGAPSSTR